MVSIAITPGSIWHDVLGMFPYDARKIFDFVAPSMVAFFLMYEMSPLQP